MFNLLFGGDRKGRGKTDGRFSIPVSAVRKSGGEDGHRRPIALRNLRKPRNAVAKEPARPVAAKSALARLWREEAGVVGLISALMVVILLGFTGLAIDASLWELNARKMQTAADEAALAGAVAAAANANVTSAATAVAGNFGYVDGQNGTSVLVNQDYHNQKEVEVTISAIQPQFLSRIFLSAPTVTKAAVAQPPSESGNGNMCVLALDQAGTPAISVSGTTNANFSNCNLYDNSVKTDSLAVSGGAVLSASHMFLSGGYSISNNATMTPDPPTATNAGTIADPYASLAVPSYLGCGQSNFSVSSGQVVTASPGVYCGGISVAGGATLNLNPGTYIIDGGNLSISGNGTLAGTGVTIILTSSTGSNYGTVDFAGGSIVTLTAPTADAGLGIPGIALWVDKNAPLATDTLAGGTTQNIGGVVYMPSQALDYAGGDTTSAVCTQLVAYTITFTGNSVMSTTGCTAAGIPVQSPAPPRLVL